MRTQTPIEITDMNYNTAKQVAALEEQLFSDPWSLRALREELANPAATWLVAKKAHRVAGFIGVHRILDEMHILQVGVVQEQRRRGIAGLLLGTVVELASQRRMNVILLEVRQSNLAALSLYRSFGFEQVGRRPDYYHNPTEDALLLTKFLQPPVSLEGNEQVFS